MEDRIQISSKISSTYLLNRMISQLLRDIDIKVLGGLLMLYVSMQLIFGLETNVIYSNLVNILLLGFYILIAIYRKHKGLYLGNISICFTLFTLVCILSAGWAMDWTKSVSWFRSLIILNINIVLFYDIITRYNIQKVILYGFVIGAICNHGIALDLISYNNPYQSETRRFLGTVGNPNILSTIILLGLISSGILIEKANSIFIKLFHGINIGLCFYTIFLSMSRKGIAIAIIILFIFLLKNIRTLKSLFGTILISLLLIHFGINYLDMDKTVYVLIENIERIQLALDLSSGGGDPSGNSRIEYLNLGANLFIHSPIWGYGFNNFSYFTGFHYSHNNYIEILTGTGLIGFILFYFNHFKIIYRSHFINSTNIRILIYASILIILVSDLGTVSYLKKHTMTMLVFLDSFLFKLTK